MYPEKYCFEVKEWVKKIRRKDFPVCKRMAEVGGSTLCKQSWDDVLEVIESHKFLSAKDTDEKTMQQTDDLTDDAICTNLRP